MYSSAASLALRSTRSPLLASRLGSASRRLCERAESRDLAIRLRNSFTLLGVKPDAPPKEIKAAYYKLARQTHPDVIGQPEGDAGPAPKVEHFDHGMLDDPEGPPPVVQAAYDTLMEHLESLKTSGPSSKKKSKAKTRGKTLGE
ncbi:MAG: hypothetical protein SGPRY_008176, partial [Prymnesium sp.]